MYGQPKTFVIIKADVEKSLWGRACVDKGTAALIW